jgi:hypothetical protein
MRDLPTPAELAWRVAEGGWRLLDVSALQT